MKFRSTALLSLLLCITFACEAQDNERGFHCPDKSSNQVRPEAQIQKGDMTKKAIKVPEPRYPRAAKAAGIYGDVHAEVVGDTSEGKIVWARIVDGHPLLQEAVKEVVCRVLFAPAFIDGSPIRVSGILTYTFKKPLSRHRTRH